MLVSVDFSRQSALGYSRFVGVATHDQWSVGKRYDDAVTSAWSNDDDIKPRD